MNETTWRLIILGAAMLGVFLATQGILLSAGDLLSRASSGLRFRRVNLAVLRQDEPAAGTLTERELYGTANLNWPVLQLVCGAAGILSASLVAQLPLSVAGAALGFLPRLVRNYLERQGKARVRRQVRAFVDELSLMPLDAGLAPVLFQIAERDTAGILHDRLRLHVRAQRLGGDALQVLHALAGDMRSDDLRDLTRRLDAARRGGESVEVALHEAAQEMSAEMLAQARLAAEGAPNRMLIPALVTLFPPVLVLALYPAMMYLVDSLTSVGSGRVPF